MYPDVVAWKILYLSVKPAEFLLQWILISCFLIYTFPKSILRSVRVSLSVSLSFLFLWPQVFWHPDWVHILVLWGLWYPFVHAPESVFIGLTVRSGLAEYGVLVPEFIPCILYLSDFVPLQVVYFPPHLWLLSRFPLWIRFSAVFNTTCWGLCCVFFSGIDPA